MGRLPGCGGSVGISKKEIRFAGRERLGVVFLEVVWEGSLLVRHLPPFTHMGGALGMCGH